MMRTTVNVNAGSSYTKTISTGEIQVVVGQTDIDMGSLTVKVIEDDIEIKKFYWRNGKWDNYSIIKTEVSEPQS